MKTLAEQCLKEINEITSTLIETEMSNSQNFPCLNQEGKLQFISFKNNNNLNISLKNYPYTQIYETLHNSKCYNILLIDGAMIQFLYTFLDNKIYSHRLMYMPSPNLEAFQKAKEHYKKDSLYGDIVRNSITPFPIRFDFSAKEEDFKEFYHSKSHLTLGEFEQCRIPVSSPISPISFISFILRHFYFEDRNEKINQKIYNAKTLKYSCTLTSNEQEITHISI